MKIDDIESFFQVCGGGRCPKVLINNQGDALVQGVEIDNEAKKKLNVPLGENVVFLPKEVMDDFFKNRK